MKKLLSIVMLVCLMVSVCVVPAYASHPFEAVIGGAPTPCSTFDEAVEAVKAYNGGVINAFDNINLTKSVDLPAGSYIVVAGNIQINLNGFTLSGMDNNTGAHSSFILNSGGNGIGHSLIVNGPGAIVYSSVNKSTFSYTIKNRNSDLTINNGARIIHNGGTSMSFAIDNETYIHSSSVTVNSGDISSTYTAIRQFANNWTGSGENKVTVYGGTINGGSRGIWIQNADPSNTIPNKATLSVASGSSVSKVHISVDSTLDASISVAANAVASVTQKGVPAGKILANVNGTYGYYNTVQEAFNAAGPNGSVGLAHEVVLNSDVSVPNGVTVNLNGNNVSNGKLVAPNGGSVDITDSVGGGSANVNGNTVTGGNRVNVSTDGTSTAVGPIPAAPVPVPGVPAPVPGASAADSNPYGVPSTGSERDTALMISLAVLSGSVLLFSLRRKKEA